MFHALLKFAQSQDCAAHSQSPKIAFQSQDYAVNPKIA